MAIVVATQRPVELQDFLVELTGASREELLVETSGEGALTRVRTAPPRLVVIDSTLPDADPLKLVMDIMMISAMTLTAVVTTMTEDEFHDAAEGYGVLMALPPHPAAEHGRKLAGLLDSV